MNLWIRTQTKLQLLAVDSLFVDDKQIVTFVPMRKILGEYATRERALEVLDEIQKRIISSDILVFRNSSIDYEDLPRLREVGAVVVCDQFDYIPNPKNRKKQDIVNRPAEVECVPQSVVFYEMPKE